MLPKAQNEIQVQFSYCASFRLGGHGCVSIRDSRSQHTNFEKDAVRVHFLLQLSERCRTWTTGLIGKLTEQMIEAIERRGQRRIVVLLGVFETDTIGGEQASRLI